MQVFQTSVVIWSLSTPPEIVALDPRGSVDSSGLLFHFGPGGWGLLGVGYPLTQIHARVQVPEFSTASLS